MRNTEAREIHETDGRHEFTLEGGCIVCGGDLKLRLAAGTARSVCTACRWISRPQLVRSDDGVQVIHPAGALA